MDMTKNDIIFIDEIAEILGISKNTLQRKAWRAKTGCPLKKVGKRLLAIRSEFDQWLREYSWENV